MAHSVCPNCSPDIQERCDALVPSYRVETDCGKIIARWNGLGEPTHLRWELYKWVGPGPGWTKVEQASIEGMDRNVIFECVPTGQYSILLTACIMTAESADSCSDCGPIMTYHEHCCKQFDICNCLTPCPPPNTCADGLCRCISVECTDTLNCVQCISYSALSAGNPPISDIGYIGTMVYDKIYNDIPSLPNPPVTSFSANFYTVNVDTLVVTAGNGYVSGIVYPKPANNVRNDFGLVWTSGGGSRTITFTGNEPDCAPLLAQCHAANLAYINANQQSLCPWTLVMQTARLLCTTSNPGGVGVATYVIFQKQTTFPAGTNLTCQQMVDQVATALRNYVTAQAAITDGQGAFANVKAMIRTFTGVPNSPCACDTCS